MGDEHVHSTSLTQGFACLCATSRKPGIYSTESNLHSDLVVGSIWQQLISVFDCFWWLRRLPGWRNPVACSHLGLQAASVWTLERDGDKNLKAEWGKGVNKAVTLQKFKTGWKHRTKQYVVIICQVYKTQAQLRPRQTRAIEDYTDYIGNLQVQSKLRKPGVLCGGGWSEVFKISLEQFQVF